MEAIDYVCLRNDTRLLSLMSRMRVNGAAAKRDRQLKRN
jgi:hypothetical protein